MSKLVLLLCEIINMLYFFSSVSYNLSTLCFYIAASLLYFSLATIEGYKHWLDIKCLFLHRFLSYSLILIPLEAFTT